MSTGNYRSLSPHLSPERHSDFVGSTTDLAAGSADALSTVKRSGYHKIFHSTLNPERNSDVVGSATDFLAGTGDTAVTLKHHAIARLPRGDKPAEPLLSQETLEPVQTTLEKSGASALNEGAAPAIKGSEEVAEAMAEAAKVGKVAGMVREVSPYANLLAIPAAAIASSTVAYRSGASISQSAHAAVIGAGEAGFSGFASSYHGIIGSQVRTSDRILNTIDTLSATVATTTAVAGAASTMTGIGAVAGIPLLTISAIAGGINLGVQAVRYTGNKVGMTDDAGIIGNIETYAERHYGREAVPPRNAHTPQAGTYTPPRAYRIAMMTPAVVLPTASAPTPTPTKTALTTKATSGTSTNRSSLILQLTH